MNAEMKKETLNVSTILEIILISATSNFTI